MNKKVSVIIPVYNTEPYLRRCLDSIVTQTLSDIEIIVIDDGSPDNSLEIIKEYDKKYDNLTYYSTKNRGLSAARNLGLSHALGETVLFVDSDDYAAPNMLERMYQELTENHCDVAICNFSYCFDTAVSRPVLNLPAHRVIENYDAAFTLKTLRGEDYVGNCVYNKLYNRAFLKSTGLLFEDTAKIYAEDGYFYDQMVSKLRRICIFDESLYFYYQRGDSIMNTYKENLAGRITNFLKGLDAFYKPHPAYGEIRQALKGMAFRFLIEILANELRRDRHFCAVKPVLTDPFFRSYMAGMDCGALSLRRRMLYRAYRMKLYYPIYVMFLTYNHLFKRGN